MHVHISRHRNHGYVPADDCLCFALIYLCMMVCMWLLCECGVFCFGNSSVYLGKKDFTGWMDKSFRAMVKVIYILYIYMYKIYIWGYKSVPQVCICMYICIYIYVYVYVYMYVRLCSHNFKNIHYFLWNNTIIFKQFRILRTVFR